MTPPTDVVAIERRRLSHALLGVGGALVSTPLLAVVLAVLAWPVDTLASPGSVSANSWPTALHLARVTHAHWGPDIAFTYGPLGFLRFPFLYYTDTLRLALLYTVGAQIALSFSLLYVLRRYYGLLLGCSLTLLALVFVFDERLAAAVFIWSVVALRTDAPPAVRDGFAPAVGAVAALETLVKLNGGAIVLIMGVIVSLALGGRRARNLGLLFGSFLASFLVLWLVAGQRLGDLGSYLAGSREMVLGYASILSGSDPDTTAALWMALGTLLAGFGLAVSAVRGGAVRRGWGVYVLWGVSAFFLFKEGFVRSDTAHRPIFFGFVLCALMAFAWRNRWQRAVVVVAAPLVSLAVWWSSDPSHLQLAVPGERLDTALSQLRTVTETRPRARAQQALRTRLQHHYRLDAQQLVQLRGRTVAILPWEFAAAYAYRLRWRPLLTIVPSSTYTTWLDERTAKILRSPAAPARILRSSKRTLDHRNTAWEGPAAMRTLLCRYRELGVTPTWQVLGRAASRCGVPRTVATVPAHWGQTVRVPTAPARTMLMVRIRGVVPGGLETLTSAAYKPAPRHLAIVGVDTFRLVPGTAADGLVLWVPRGLDYTGPYALNQRAHALWVSRGSGAQHGGSITYEFQAVPIRPFGAR